MKNKLLGFASAVILFTTNQLSLANCCGPAVCDPCPTLCNPCPSNWYIAASGSVAWHNDHDFDFNGVDDDGPFTERSSRDYKIGGGAAMSVGYIFDLCNCWDIRAEGEILWRRNSLKNVNINFVQAGFPDENGRFSASGYTQDLALMANLIADFPLYCNLAGYVGGGIGVSFNQITMTSLDGVTQSPARRNDELFAWQFLAGLSYNICPNIAFTAGYRLFATQKVKSQGDVIKSKHIPFTQSIDIGIRFRL